MSNFRYAHLEGRSVSSEQVSDLEFASEAFDLVFLAPSWDRRSTEITKATGVQSDGAFIIDFENRGRLGLRDVHDPKIRAYAQDIANDTCRVSGASEDLEYFWDRISEVLVDAHKHASRPLRVLVDLTGCPRYYSVGILGWGFRRGIVGVVSYFYSEALYGDILDGRGEIFTLGGWRTRAIPGLEGRFDPSLERHYVVSVGFEGAKTLRAVTKGDPDDVSILFPEPGVEPEYVELARQANEELYREFGVTGEQVVQAAAADPIQAWGRLRGSGLDDVSKFNNLYLCSGTKPHSLGMALEALSSTQGAVLYNQPLEHRETATESNGIYWRYDIWDHSAVW